MMSDDGGAEAEPSVPDVAALDAVAPGSPAAEPGHRRPTERWWRIAWYPAALPVVYVVAVWSASAIHPGWLVRPILVTVAVVLLATFLLTRLLGDRHRGGLAAWVLSVALLLTDDRLRTVLLLLTALIIGEGLIHRGRQWRHGERVTRFMSVLAASLLVVGVIGALQLGALQGGVADVQADLDARHAEAFDASAPDIYMILVDGYPGDDAAALDPTFDADAFPAALAARGFDVERNARTNYLTTRLTVAAMFGDQHVEAAPELAPPFGNHAADARRLRLFGDDGVVFRALRDAGYETITVTSPAAHIGLRRVDRVIDPPGPSEFENVLLKGTAVGPFLDAVAPDLFAAIARDQVLSTYASAEAIAAEPHSRPRFVWVHVMAPHPPFLFSADGSPIVNVDVVEDEVREPSSPGWRSARIRQTFDYAAFIARRTETLLDRMSASLTRTSVMVVFSDHGPETGFDSSSPLTSDLDERSSIVLAVRTPGRPGLLPAGATPIGVLPRILNAYLGTSLPIRSDSIWGWPTDGSLLDAVPIDPGGFTR